MVDPIMSDHLTVLMLRLKKQLKLTSIVVTHDLDLLHRVADQVVFLSKGKSGFFRAAGGTVCLGRSGYSGVPRTG